MDTVLEPVPFCPDPLSEPTPRRAANRCWLGLWIACSSAVHVSLALAIPRAERLPPAPVFQATEVFDIDPAPEPPPPPPPVASDPVEPVPSLQPSPSPSPRPATPAPPALAAAVLTAHDNAGPLDFTDEFVTGQATTFSGGATSSRGVASKTPLGSTGAAAAQPSGIGQPPSRDHSRRASVVGGFAWSCPFPPAADSAGIDLAVVQLRLRVGALGRLDDVGVVADPGYGFAEAARRCAVGKRFLPALDRSGTPVSSELAVRVRFTR